MTRNEEQLNRIQEKLQQLLKQYSYVRKENDRLKEELSETKEKLSRNEKMTEELSQQVAVLKMNAGGLAEQDKKELEKKINHYLREIDRCIALLGE
ncbi:MAG: hypothetical protein IAE96_03725 [Chitinophagaceae bacterium]|nr:hypothetical protein [Chitinophagaceae bacterium]